MNSLIANSGLHFVVTEADLDFEQPFVLPSGKMLKYSFVEITNPFTAQVTYDLAYFNPATQQYIPLSELEEADALQTTSNGRQKLNEAGMPTVIGTTALDLFSSFQQGAPELTIINSTQSLRIKDSATGESQAAYNFLLGKWLPMPMFEKEMDGVTTDGPYGWCRVRIDAIGEGQEKGTIHYRFTWAFDTRLSDNVFEAPVIRPTFASDDDDRKDFCLCNRAKQLISFMSTGQEFNKFSSYIRGLFGIDMQSGDHKYIAYYIYFINYIRLSGVAPEVSLFRCEDDDRQIPVDMVLDIGNSRTCGVLLEKGVFHNPSHLSLRDISQPWKVYSDSFDMRVVFRKSDFGNDIFGDDELFIWPSFLRVGEEAKNLVYDSREDDGLSERTTNYSSPKRYLWDNASFTGKWEFLRTNADSAGVRFSPNVYIERLSEMFDAEGRYYPVGSDVPFNPSGGANYSRSSLITLVMIELLMQATCQINSLSFRKNNGDVDRKRVLRRVVVTCPTAMPLREQIRLREAAEEAADAVLRMVGGSNKATIIPSSASLRVADADIEESATPRQWSYDEASCCQLVYLYSEVAQRYGGEIDRFINLKGHVREDSEDGKRSLTICSIDIGAGTTDVMISNYSYTGRGNSRITPRPLFYDSYYIAGDDIVRDLIVKQVLERPHFQSSPNRGPIANALNSRMQKSSNSELREQLTYLLHHPVDDVRQRYGNRLDVIEQALNDDQREGRIRDLAVDLMHDFFGVNSLKLGARHQRTRSDFNTQILQHIACFYLELQRKHYPARTYTFEDIFATRHPSAHLLDDFNRHFGFRFEELEWAYDPVAVSEDIRSSMENLMKVLSEVVYMHHCDILVLAGRPTALDAITDLFIKYIPIAPNRQIRLGDYRVGEWYPFTYGQGYFSDQKSIVAVGGIIGYLASHGDVGFSAGEQPAMVLDFAPTIKQMKSTALYLGEYKADLQQVRTPLLTPTKGNARVVVQALPLFIGCSQFNSSSYQARPLYALYGNAGISLPVTITLSRNFFENREELVVEDISDSEGNELSPSSVSLVQQSIIEGSNFEHWLDSGIFKLTVMGKEL